MFQQIFTRVGGWLDTPIGQVVLLWILVSVIGAIVKPRTPESYAKMAAMRPAWFWSRVAALLQLVGGLGIDPKKVGFALAKLITGYVVSASAMQRGLLPPASERDDDSPDGGTPPLSTTIIAAAVIVDPDDKSSASASVVEERRGSVSLMRFASVVVLALSVLTSSMGVAVLLTGCNARDAKTANDITRTGLSVAQKSCVMLNAFMPRSDLAKWCKIADPYLSALDEILPAAAAAYQAQHPKLAGALPPKRFVCEDSGAGATCVESTQ